MWTSPLFQIFDSWRKKHCHETGTGTLLPPAAVGSNFHFPVPGKALPTCQCYWGFFLLWFFCPSATRCLGMWEGKCCLGCRIGFLQTVGWDETFFAGKPLFVSVSNSGLMIWISEWKLACFRRAFVCCPCFFFYSVVLMTKNFHKILKPRRELLLEWNIQETSGDTEMSKSSPETSGHSQPFVSAVLSVLTHACSQTLCVEGAKWVHQWGCWTLWQP